MHGITATAASLNESLAFVRSERARLLNHYHGDEQLLRGAAVLPAANTDTALRARLGLVAVGRQAQLVIGAAGSSVTAGHDGFAQAAWPAVLERRLAPSIQRLGAKLVVRNHAVGGTNPNPAALCLAPMLGTDVDLVLREWEYWPFSSGLSQDRLAKPSANVEHAGVELFLRTALSLPKQPAVHFLSMSSVGDGMRSSFLGSWVHGSVLDKPGGGGSQGSSRRRSLMDYADFSLQGFTHFGASFARMRAARDEHPEVRWKRNEVNRTHCDGGPDVGLCPVSPTHGDGYHRHASWVRSHTPPGWWRTDADARGGGGDINNLFINWHPGPLGHELIGHQLADYYLALLEETLEAPLLSAAVAAEAAAHSGSGGSKRGGGGDRDGRSGHGGGLAHVAAALEREVQPLPLPANAACADAICAHPPRCAYTFLPKAEGPDVGDWMRNSSSGAIPGGNVVKGTGGSGGDTSSGWQNVVVPGQPACPSHYTRTCVHAANGSWVDSVACYSLAKTCSYADQKRGFAGGATDGPFTLSFDGSILWQCLVLVAEPEYGWNKPREAANWAQELQVSVNGAPCAPPECTFAKEGKVDMVWVDAHALLGSACRRQTFTVSLAVKPLGAAAFEAEPVCQITGTHREYCEPVGIWKGYDFKCERQGGPDECVPKRTEPWARTRPGSEVRAWVTHVIAF